ncbi:hypothetical protein ON010_g12664 [Phytophthora cinnamomi]|nr:hypothetical protein ON010_g12664 [Phytophthora cinnamomi]
MRHNDGVRNRLGRRTARTAHGKRKVAYLLLQSGVAKVAGRRLQRSLLRIRAETVEEDARAWSRLARAGRRGQGRRSFRLQLATARRGNGLPRQQSQRRRRDRGRRGHRLARKRSAVAQRRCRDRDRAVEVLDADVQVAAVDSEAGRTSGADHEGRVAERGLEQVSA